MSDSKAADNITADDLAAAARSLRNSAGLCRAVLAVNPTADSLERVAGWLECVLAPVADDGIPTIAGEWRGPDGSRWQHVKRGSRYVRLGIAELQMSHDLLVDGIELFVYVGADGKAWAREVTEFDDGRFVPDSPATGRDVE